MHEHLVTARVEEMPEAARRHAATIEGRAALCRRARIIPFECVVRGYLAGSAAKEYEASGTVGGERVAPGLRPGDRLAAPLFTPTTKAEAGHDEPVAFAAIEEAVGARLAGDLRACSLELYSRASEVARERGLILVDTKLEWGLDGAGRLTLCDEVFTPDSSRYWLAEEWRPGHQPEPLDKQVVRNWLLASSWDRQGPPPALPPEVVVETSRRYLRLFRLLTGASL